MSLGPFDLTGEPFLILYSILLGVTVFLGLIIAHRLRPEGRAQRVTDVDQLAYLSGGRARFIDAFVARLLAAGSLHLVGRKTFDTGLVANGGSIAERNVLASTTPIGWPAIERTLRTHVEPVERKLILSGLLMTDAERSNLRFWAVLPYLMLLVFGATKWVIGDMRERPVGFLTILLVLTAICAFIRWKSVDNRTVAGRNAVFDAKRESVRLSRAPTDAEVALAVALFGTIVLAGSAWSDFHLLRSASTGGDGGGGGSDSGSDGGGCGGGGCGGCGG